MKQSRSRSVSRVANLGPKVTIEHFLPSKVFLSPEREAPTVIDISSEKKPLAKPVPPKKKAPAKGRPRATQKPEELTLEVLLRGAPIFIVKRKKKVSIKYYWRNAELLRFYIVSVGSNLAL